MDRRRFLRVAVAGSVAGLAGCTGDDGTGTDPTTTAATDRTTAGGGATTGTPAGTTTATATETATGTPAGTPTATATETPTATTTPATTAAAPQSAVEVLVGANSRARFGPETFRLERGGTVTWVWEGNSHNVVPSTQPGDADWSGTPGGTRTYDAGYEYEYTFEVPGSYEYYCSVHRGIGMTGSFEVVDP